MSEKVLGFKEKDAHVAEINCKIVGLQRQSETQYQINESELVPVVSLKALKKWCKEHEEDSDIGMAIYADALIGWAEKEANK